MRFAYSRHNQSIKAQIRAWIEQSRSKGLSVHALLDGSMFSQHDIKRLATASIHFSPALLGSPFENLELQGPLFWSMNESDPKKQSIMLRHTDGIPALSLIATAKPIESLRELLVWLAVAHTQDEQKLHCSFADTRVLPSLLHCLKPDQFGRLGQSMGEWLWITRAGGIETRPFPDQAKQATQENDAFQLDVGQFDFMLASAEADMVFQMLAEKMPDLIPDMPPHEIHARISRLLDTARSHGITDLPELFQYAVVGLSTRDDFDTHPAVRNSWERIRREGLSFSTLAEQWPEAFWQAFTLPDDDTAVDPE